MLYNESNEQNGRFFGILIVRFGLTTLDLSKLYIKLHKNFSEV